MNRKSISTAVAGLGLVAIAAPALASDIVVFDVRAAPRMFRTTTTDDFVGNYTPLTTTSTLQPSFAMDTADGVNLYAIENPPADGFANPIWHLDIPSGTLNEIFGLITGVPADDNYAGLSYNAVDGMWYVVGILAPTATLYRGDIVTGVFAPVGVIGGSGFMIDISIDSAGNCYGHDLGDDMLYSIDLTTGVGTPIGPTGQAANFAQGMDFDPCDDTLYATIYTGGGTGVFASFDLSTGAANVIQSTTSLNAEMEMVVLPSDPCGGGTVCPASATILAGTNVSGGPADICDEDGTLWTVSSTTFAAVFSPAPVQVQFEGDVSPLGGGNLTLRLVGGPQFGNNTAFISLRMWNWTTSTYTNLPFINQADSSNTVYEDTRAAADFVGPNGEVRAQITCAKTALGPVRLRMDQVGWTVN